MITGRSHMSRRTRNVFKSLAIIAACLAASTVTVAQTADDRLIGFWENVTQFTDASPKEIVITRDGAGIHARVGGSDCAVETKRGIRFTIPGQGTFRGRFGGNEKVIDGFWAQTPGELPGLQNPYDQAYASPVTHKRSGKNAWKGSVTPLPQRLTMYL
jgi:hypothetical protein